MDTGAASRPPAPAGFPGPPRRFQDDPRRLPGPPPWPLKAKAHGRGQFQGPLCQPPEEAGRLGWAPRGAQRPERNRGLPLTPRFSASSHNLPDGVIAAGFAPGLCGLRGRGLGHLLSFRKTSTAGAIVTPLQIKK